MNTGLVYSCIYFALLFTTSLLYQQVHLYLFSCICVVEVLHIHIFISLLTTTCNEPTYKQGKLSVVEWGWVLDWNSFLSKANIRLAEKLCMVHCYLHSTLLCSPLNFNFLNVSVFYHLAIDVIIFYRCLYQFLFERGRWCQDL